MKKKPDIVFLDSSTIGEVKALQKIASLGNLITYAVTNESERIDRIKGNEVVITNKVVIDKEVIDSCPEIKLICVAATGINNIDHEYASKKGIIVKNVAGYSTESVAQITFSMLIYLLTKIHYFDNYVKSLEYCKSPIFTNHGRSFYELNGKQLGIIGLGTIGSRVAQIAESFGMKVCYYSTSGENNSTKYARLSLEELLKTSDIITIHCPLNAATENLIGYQQIKLMKTSAILLNVGRGKIVNEADLAKALDENLILAAGLDVLEKEPIHFNNPLLSVKYPEKLLITPHIAWISEEAREKLVDTIYEHIKLWTENQMK